MATTPQIPTPMRVVNQSNDPRFRAMVTPPEDDPSPIGSGNWIGNWTPEEVNNIASLGSLGAQQDNGMIADQNAAIRSRDEQLALINGQDLGGTNPYQSAALSTLGAQREAAANRDFQINELRNARDQQARMLERNTSDDIAARRATFQPSLNKLKALYNSQGILNSSAFSGAVDGLQGEIDAYAQKAQRDLGDRLNSINETYNSRVTSLGATYQTKLDSIQNVLTQRLENIEKSKAATEKSKLQARMDVMKDYQDTVSNIKKEYQDKADKEEKQRQQIFDNEIKMANLTGVFRGSQTLSAQKFAADEDYRQQQLALSIMKANKSGSSSGGSAGLPADIQAALAQVQKLQEQGLTALDAKAIVEQQFNAAGKRAFNAAFAQALTSPSSGKSQSSNPLGSIIGGIAAGAAGGLSGALAGGLGSLLNAAKKTTTSEGSKIKLVANQLKTPQKKQSEDDLLNEALKAALNKK